ncbi:MAG: hypothetical protein DMF78_21850, partial [Acidobacteria bacterium]
MLLLAAGVLAGLGIAVVGWVLATTAGDGGASGVFAERARPQESSASVRPAPSAPSAACVEAEALLEDAWGAGHLEADPAVARAREVFARVSAADAASPCAAAGLAAAEALNPARSIGDDVPPTPDRARKLLARARALDGQSVLVARTDALLKSEAGDNAGAAQVMEAAVATDESRPGPWRDLARYHGRQFRVNKARAAFQRARALSSSPVDQARVHLE